MAAEPPRRQDRAGKYRRKLIYIPIVHTPADMGALGGDLARAAQRKLGQRGWQHKVRLIDQIWTEVERTLGGLELPRGKVRLYQDGLPVCGREEAIVSELAGAGSRNYQILKDLMARGATLMGTESWELLQEEYRQARESLASPGAPGKAPGPPTPAPLGEASVLARRDRFIAQRINDTLKEGETGILFLGMLHAVEPYLSRDIQVLHPCRTPRG